MEDDIQRWGECDPTHEPCEQELEGRFVLYTDHWAKIDCLAKKLMEAREDAKKARDELAKAREAACPFPSDCTRYMMAATLGAALADEPPNLMRVRECAMPEPKEAADGKA